MDGPHQRQPLRVAGTPVEEAEAAVIILHGRGASARSILQLTGEFAVQGVAYLAPQAAGSSWYPDSFLAPVDNNEPGRSSALQVIDDAIDMVGEGGIPPERVLVMGFSQGACLSSEYVARHPRKYGGLAVLSGGLIGEEIEAADYTGDLEGTPAFLGCSDVDPHIPEERVHTTAEILKDMGAEVTTRIYEGMGHGVNEDEIEHVTEMVERLVE